MKIEKHIQCGEQTDSPRTWLLDSFSFSNFLWREFQLKKARNPRYSISSLAKSLRLSRSFVHDLLRGKRGPSSETLTLLSRQLRLSSIEEEYLTDLAMIEHSKNEKERSRAQTRINKRRFLRDLQFHEFAEGAEEHRWHHGAIKALAHCSNHGNSADAFAKHLGLSTDKARNAIEIGLQSGELLRDSHGRICSAESLSCFKTFRTAHDKSMVLREIFEEALRRIEAGTTGGGEQWLFYALDADQLPKAQAALQNYFQELAFLASSAKAPSFVRMALAFDHRLGRTETPPSP